ncbi:MAG: spore protease YyaC [Eubacterium sp.]
MTHYFNPNEPLALRHFTDTLSGLLEKQNLKGRDIVILCIGSDRATGDSLGPMVGHLLVRIQKNFHLYGTLKNPVHAKNLEDALTFIKLNHKDPFIIAIDASLGVAEHIGYITLGEGSLAPGVGVAKKLPVVGDLCITGIVNLSGFGGQMLLQTTRLSLVIELASFIAGGLRRCLCTPGMSQFCSSLQRAK